MKKVSATEAKTHLGQHLEAIHAGPVVIQKKDRPVAVLLSMDEYDRLRSFEDAYWSARAEEAEKSGWLGVEESMKLLKDAIGEKPQSKQ